MTKDVEIKCSTATGKMVLNYPHDVKEIKIDDRSITDIDLREFEKLKHLEKLTLSWLKIQKLDLSPIGAHPSLVVFNTWYFKTIEPLDLSTLENCRSLQELRIENYRVEDSGLNLSQLPRLPSLRIFSIAHSEVVDSNIEILSEWKALEEVDFSMSLHENLTFSPLSELPKLKRVIVGGCAIREVDLTPLGKCAELEELKITGIMSGGLEVIDLSPLAYCRKLRILDLSDQYLKNLDLAPLKNHPSIEELILESMVQLESLNLKPLNKCSSLKVLDLSRGMRKANLGPMQMDLSPLASLTSLEVLNLRGQEVNIKELSGSKSLHHLILSRCTLVEADFSALSGNSELRTLELEYIKEIGEEKAITSLSLKPLSGFTNLEILNISVNKIDEIDLQPLRNCHRLKKLALNNNPFISLNLQPIEACKELEELRINNIGLKTIDLAALTECVNLRILRIHHNYLEELDLRPLRICEKLEDVRIDANRLHELRIDPRSKWASLRVFSASANQLEELSLEFLRNNTTLEAISLEKNKIENLDLNPLEKCVKLKKINISKNNLEMIDLQPLTGLPELRYLQISQNEITEINYQQLSRMRNLAELDLDGNRLTGVDFESLSKCNNLHKLDLSDNPLGYLELRQLQLFDNLNVIRAGISDRRNRVQAPMVNVPEGMDANNTIFVIPNYGPKGKELYLDVSQESLELSKARYNLDFLSLMKNLKSLSISSTGMDRDDISEIAKCSTLVSFLLDGIDPPPASILRSTVPSSPPELEHLDFSFLADFPDLESVSVKRIRGLKSVTIDGLSKCKNLNKIELYLDGTKFIDISPLADCPSLKEIGIGSGRVEVSKGSRFSNLESFELSVNAFTPDIFESLSEASRLKSIIISRTTSKEKEIDLSPLSSLTSMTKLIIRIDGLDSLDVTPLMTLSNLEYISFNGGKIVGDAFIEYANPLLAKRITEFIRPSSLIKDTVSTSGWHEVQSLLRAVIQNSGRESADMWDQLFILRMLDMPELACFDGDVLDLLGVLPKEANYDDGLESFKLALINNLEKQLEAGGVSLFLDPEKLTDSVSSKLGKITLDRRSKEIEQLVIFRAPNIDLRPLWLTRIGFKALKELDSDLDCSIFFLNEIEKKIVDYGVQLNISEESESYSVKASEMMMQYIFERASGYEERP
jgi:Leucine-rich repeat (LRR) protein